MVDEDVMMVEVVELECFVGSFLVAIKTTTISAYSLNIKNQF